VAHLIIETNVFRFLLAERQFWRPAS
jgi:hypothetical protein